MRYLYCAIAAGIVTPWATPDTTDATPLAPLGMFAALWLVAAGTVEFIDTTRTTGRRDSGEGDVWTFLSILVVAVVAYEIAQLVWGQP